MIGFNGGGSGDCDYPELAYDSEPEPEPEPIAFKLIQQDAPRAQGGLFDGGAGGIETCELLRTLIERHHRNFATVDDALGYARSPENDSEPGVCIQCGIYTGDVPKPWAKTKCAKCETYTVTAITVIAGERRA